MLDVYVLNQYRRTQVLSECILDENLNARTDQEIDQILDEIEKSKFGQFIEQNAGENYEGYCERVLDIYLSNLGKIRQPEFYGLDEGSGVSDHQLNLSFIQFLCHMYAYCLENLHLNSHKSIEFQNFGEVVCMIITRLKSMRNEQGLDKKGASMVLELCISLILDLCDDIDLKKEELLTEDFSQFIELVFAQEKYYSRSVFSELLIVLNELFYNQLFEDCEIKQSSRVNRRFGRVPPLDELARDVSDKKIQCSDVTLFVTMSPWFRKIQCICLEFILTKVNKFSREREWYLKSLLKGMDKDELEEHLEEFIEDPYCELQEEFEVEYFQMIQNLAVYYKWPQKESIIDEMMRKKNQSYDGNRANRQRNQEVE